MIIPSKLNDPYRTLSLIWESRPIATGGYSLTCRSHLQVHNRTNIDLSFFMFLQSWKNGDVYVGNALGGQKLVVPLQFAAGTHIRIGKKRHCNATVKGADLLSKFMTSERLMILPTGFISSSVLRCSINCEDSKDDTRPINLVVRVESDGGITDVFIDPVLRIVNLLPCTIQCQLGEAIPEGAPPCERGIGVRNRGRVSIETTEECNITVVSPTAKPHISIRVPGYNWSQWCRIVNLKSNSETWMLGENDISSEYRSSEENTDHAEDYKSIIQFDRLGGGDPLLLIFSVEQNHTPILRIYAQYWIVNKTGFGLRFCEGISLLGGSVGITSRRSYALPQEKTLEMNNDQMISGHEWTLGVSGMTIYFSVKQKICFRIENMEDCEGITSWSSVLDISNVMPRTVITIEEEGISSHRFEFAIEITLCQSSFTRTKLITIYPRYIIINLLDFDLLVSQYGSFGEEKRVQKQTSLPYHWNDTSLPPQIRLACVTQAELLWSNGCIQLDRIGITAMRLPTTTGTRVVQIEVRLASKFQNCAVAIVIWSTNEGGNPLYMLKNVSSKIIRCAQPLRSTCEEDIDKQRLSSKDYSYWWTVLPHESLCYGFEDPERPHVLDVFLHDPAQTSSRNHRYEINIDAMGSHIDIAITELHKVRCHIKAERSTKIIEFTDIWNNEQVARFKHRTEDFLEFRFRLDIPGVSISVIDATLESSLEVPREILFLSLSNLILIFLQGQDGHHSIELILDSIQIDNHIPDSSHSVLVSISATYDLNISL